jgi:2,5-furandicarboxylate decarboxylase 1
MEASRDLFIVPDARGHEYIRVGKNGVRAKLGVDATIPFNEKSRFARCEFVDVDAEMSLSSDPALLRSYLGR